MLDEQNHAQIASDSGSQPAGAVRQKWTLTQEAFDKLLLSLGDDRESGGAKYLEIRSNLIRFFEWRGCPFPEDHADETINRMAKRVGEGEQIENPSGYAMGIARLLVLEIIKGRQREQVALTEISTTTTELADESSDGEERIGCLRQCLSGLPTESRQLITEYYEGEKGDKIQNRKRLVEKLGIPVNTLRMRALRLRDRLQVCVEDCLSSS
jgi:DNA-directed RNA polymerase specialized sigma24 family protein